LEVTKSASEDQFTDMEDGSWRFVEVNWGRWKK